MIKELNYENLDTGSALRVRVEVREDQGRWSAKILPSETGESGPGAPVFYGSTAEQAERQLRKVFERDHELSSERVVG